ncbi:MAG: helix-hairpin-helix domain-containing protein, partial [Pseudomonadota bacterium]
FVAQALDEIEDGVVVAQRLHRFAIGTHRAKRAKSMSKNPLDDIPGVGATRKRALLAHFGSAKAVSRANLADLKAVEGVSAALAKKVFDHFHEKG